VRKRQRRLDRIDERHQDRVVVDRARLTTGEVSAHFADIYGVRVGKDTISRITNLVLEEMAEWCARPLDAVYQVIFIDALVVKIRDGQVTNSPI
jgi:putative transposase